MDFITMEAAVARAAGLHPLLPGNIRPVQSGPLNRAAAPHGEANQVKSVLF